MREPLQWKFNLGIFELILSFVSEPFWTQQNHKMQKKLHELKRLAEINKTLSVLS